VVMRSPFAGAALDPPAQANKLNKAVSLRLTLSLYLPTETAPSMS